MEKIVYLPQEVTREQAEDMGAVEEKALSEEDLEGCEFSEDEDHE